LLSGLGVALDKGDEVLLGERELGALGAGRADFLLERVD